jgi:hypothetical protein
MQRCQKGITWQIKWLSAALLLPTLLVGCGSSHEDAVETGKARIRVVNALIGANDTLDPAVGDTKLTRRVPLGGTTAYYGIEPSGQTITLTPSAAEDMGTGGQAAFTGTVDTLQRGTSYSLAVIGVVGGSGTEAPRLLTLREPADPSPAPDTTNGDSAEASVRIVNLSPDAGPADLLRNDVPVAGAGRVTFGNGSAYIPIHTEDATLKVRVADNDTAQDIAVMTSDGALLLARGRSYTVFIVGLRQPETNSGREELTAVMVLDK